MKQALERNSDIDKRLLFLVDTITEIVWEATPDGNIVYANKKWYDYIGQAPGSDIAKAWLEVIHPDDKQPTNQIWQHSLTTGEPYEAELRFKEAATGKYNWFIGRARAFKDKKGNIIRWYGTCTNIEAQKQSDRLLELNRSKDEFISIASHQLRTPATGVKQVVGMLRDELFGKLNDKQKNLVDKAYESNERQLRIITDLLKVAQVDSGKVTLHKIKLDINHLVNKVVRELYDVFHAREQTLVVNALSGQAFASVDQDTIMMVLENLIDNASKYTEQRGTVTIDMQETGHEVMVRVIDEGVGINKKDEGRLFKKFNRIDNILSTKVGGTGLGLYWAYKIVALHGGSLTYHPNTPKGSIFIMKIPK